MKRTALALTLILALLGSALTGTKLFNQAEANPSPSGPDDTFRIVSPENKTYSTNNITLTVASEHVLLWSCIVDGAYVYDLLTTRESPLSFNLSDGSHTIIASAFHLGSACVTFTIDTTAPKVSVASPENKTYNMFDVPLNFTVDELVSQIAYSLGGQNNVTVAGNTTLTGLSAGEYNVTVYAQDLVGNVGASETVHFNMAEEPEPFPVVPVAVASGVSIAVAGLLVYSKKRKH